MKTPTTQPDAIDRAVRRIEAVERLALKARGVMDMPTGTPALDAAQDAPMAALDRELARLKRTRARDPR